MFKLGKLAFRNLYRQTSRTLLTVGLIALGVVAVLLFTATAGSFKTMMIGQITDSMLGHLQIHPAGYVESIDNVPLNLNLDPDELERVRTVLKTQPGVEAFSHRILLAGGLSNYRETTNVRLAAIDPDRERSVVPLLEEKVQTGHFLREGEILVPELVAKGMQFEIGQDVVLIATNEEGSVNGINLRVAGIIETTPGPSGRFGYLHLHDAKRLLRMDELRVSEIAVRLTAMDRLPTVMSTVRRELAAAGEKPVYEVHSWRELTPFSTLANMIDMMNWFVQFILVAIVLISIMNVMIMAVYERTPEIGTLSAIGTPARRILGMFLAEGLLLGVFGVAVGTAGGQLIIQLLQYLDIRFTFARMDNVRLNPSLAWSDVGFIAVLVVGITLLGVLQPSFKASRMEPVEALDS